MTFTFSLPAFLKFKTTSVTVPRGISFDQTMNNEDSESARGMIEKDEGGSRGSNTLGWVAREDAEG